MKKFLSIVIISALISATFAACAGNREPIENSSSSSSSSLESVSSSSSSSVESSSSFVESSSSKSENEESVSSSSAVESSTTTNNPTSSTIEEKPVSSSSKPVSSSSKPVSSSSKPASSSSKPVSSSSKPASSSSKPASSSSKPVEIPTHNCKNDGHIWGNSYTESSTENVEIVETHGISNNGFDFTLSSRYFGLTNDDINFTPYLGTDAFGEGSSKVKTTGVKTTTKYIHECSECGYKEVYNTEKTVTPGDNWVFVNKPRSQFFPVIWYDINNIPDEVYEGLANLQEWEKANGF